MDTTFAIPVGPPAQTTPKDTFEEKSLLEFLDLIQLNCLNESPSHNLHGIVSTRSKNTSGSYLLSEADEQLLLNIHFNQAVRVRSVVLRSFAVEDEEDQAPPKTIKLLVNRPSLGFDDVEYASEKDFAQVINLSETDVKDGRRVPLRFVRFQSVTSLHIFVSSNQSGAEATRIDVLDLFGHPVETTRDLSGLRAQQDEN